MSTNPELHKASPRKRASAKRPKLSAAAEKGAACLAAEAAEDTADLAYAIAADKEPDGRTWDEIKAELGL